MECMPLGVSRLSQDFWDFQLEYKTLVKVCILRYIVHLCHHDLFPIVRIVLMSHNEEYIATLPSAYGRSILTVPWVELGGKCVINCPQTGYSAHMEFHCKVHLLQLMHIMQYRYVVGSLCMEARNIVLLLTFDGLMRRNQF